MSSEMLHEAESRKHEVSHAICKSEKVVREHKGQLGEVLASALGLAPNDLSESVTWGVASDPWFWGPPNDPLFLIATILVTKVRTVSNGATQCQLFIKWDWSARWGATQWRDNPPLRFSFSYENEVGGRIGFWDMGGIHSNCSMHAYPMNHSQSFQPDIYNIFKRFTIYASEGRFFHCK